MVGRLGNGSRPYRPSSRPSVQAILLLVWWQVVPFRRVVPNSSLCIFLRLLVVGRVGRVVAIYPMNRYTPWVVAMEPGDLYSHAAERWRQALELVGKFHGSVVWPVFPFAGLRIALVELCE